MKRCICLVLLAVTSGFAQSYKTCDVTMWANEPHAQLPSITHENVLYFIRVGRASYQIELPGPNVEMNSGQRIRCRVDKGFMFIRDNDGQINKIQLVDKGQPVHNR
jgi:hypothetical protein